MPPEPATKRLIELRGGGVNLLASYTAALNAAPILTKSLTAGCIFTASDVAAQSIAPSDTGRDWTRTAVSGLVGLLYFGPAAHAWYEVVVGWFPDRTIRSTLTKAALGQMAFGPVFTCVFFAATLLSTRGLQGLGQWPAKVRQDLLPTQLAGCGYWPFVDLISFSVVPLIYIPLFVNFCSFIWTIFLSLKANRGLKADKSE